MAQEEIVKRILELCPEVSMDDISKRLMEKKTKTDGLISDDTLLRMIAAELGCEISGNAPSMTRLLLRQLVPGLNDVTVTGRILAIFPSKAFGGNKKGKLASVLIADKTCILRVVLWNEKADFVDSGRLQAGKITRFLHGYTREDYRGNVEIQIAERSEIDPSPRDILEQEYPSIEHFAKQIAEVRHGSRTGRVNLVGTPKRVSPSSTFEREDSTKGKVMSFTLADGTGEIRVVVWNEKVDMVEQNLREGDVLGIVNARLKKETGKDVEVHVDSMTYVTKEIEGEPSVKIADLKERSTLINVRGEVNTRPVLRQVKTFRGETVELAVFELRDETGKINVAAWGNNAEAAALLQLGQKIFLKRVNAKKGFGEKLELSTRNASSIVPVE